MLKTLLKIICFTLQLTLVLAWTGQAYAYTIAGGMEFSYRDFETKTGNSRASNQSWTQLYRAGLGSYILDPRFLRFTAGIGYSVYGNNASPDAKNLNYDLNAVFFPGMKFNGNVYGRKSTTTIDSSSTRAGNTIETTGYGGTLNLNLSRGGGNGRRNNNNNNNLNNNSNDSRPLVLPDISLSRNHTESDSLSSANPLKETLDSTMVTLRYRPLSTVVVDFDGGLDEYQNMINHSSYDNKTSNLSTTITVSPDADLRLKGRVTDRTTQNMTGFATNQKVASYDMTLNFKERDKFRHYYSYAFTDQRTTGVDYSSQNALAGISYRLSDSLQTLGEANYGTAEYVQLATAATGTLPEQKSTLETGGALAGVLYSKQYTPNFLGPFALHTNYGFRYGFTNYSSPTGSGPQGDGFYYTNSANVGINSRGWIKESLALNYSFNNKRDQSPVHNMTEYQSWSLSFSSQRVSRTVIRATANYVEQENKSELSTVFLANQVVGGQQGLSQRSRTVTYNLTTDYAATDTLSLTAGATRGESKINTYTLSTLTPATQTIDDTVYVGANFAYLITRNLRYRATARDEYRRTQTTHTESYKIDMYLDYRIRQVFVNFESRWQEDMPDNAQRVQQRSYFVKLSRPF